MLGMKTDLRMRERIRISVANLYTHMILQVKKGTVKVNLCLYLDSQYSDMQRGVYVGNV